MAKTLHTEADKKRALFLAFLTIFLDLLGFGIIIPIQPFFAESFGASPTLVTVLGGSYSLMQFLFAPFWGRLSDRIGRRPIILMSVFVAMIGHVLFSVTSSLAMLFVARMIAGFGNANLGTAQAIVSDTTDSSSRAKGMGLIGMAFGLGFVFGPALGGFLGSTYGVRAPSIAAAVLQGLNLLLAFWLLPETRDPSREVAVHGRRAPLSLAAFRRAIRHEGVGSLFSITLVATLAFAMMEQTIGLLVQAIWVTPLGLDLDASTRLAAKLTGYCLIVVGVTATVVQGGLIGPLVKRLGERRLIRISLWVLVIALATVPLFAETGRFPVFLLSGALLAIGSGLLTPSTNSLISKSIGEDEQGGVLGLNQSLSSLGRVLGPLVAGALFEYSRAAPFLTGALILVIVGLFARRLGAPARTAA